MNINKLFPKQAELDAYIGESKGIKMEDYKTERVLALLVEWGEFLNCVPFLFKYWKSNQEMNRDEALEEYVDNLHFLLSIGNDHGFTDYEYEELPNDTDMKLIVFGITNIISRIGVSLIVSGKVHAVDYESLLDHFIYFGSQLGFTENEIITHYELKHAENYARQQMCY